MTNEEATHALLEHVEALQRFGVNLEKSRLAQALSVAIRALEAQRSGAWEWDSYYGGFYRCSVCGYEQGRKTKHCPECGASMGGGRYDKG